MIVVSRKLLISDGERNALLYEHAHGVIGGRLQDQRDARREHRVLDVVELVEARAEADADLVVQEDLVLDVAAELGAVVAARRDRQIEGVEADVAAVADARCACRSC